MRNFRDLGGHKTTDGRTVKHGLFFRSASLSNLDSQDIEKLKNLNIKNIFDYRSDEEANRNPSTIIQNINNIRVPAMSMPDEYSVKFGSVEEMAEELFEKNGAFNMLKDSYYNLPLNNQSYKKLVELIKNADSLPILNHCTAGKDRTGVGCAIILMILGVSREDIIRDYLKSNEYAKESIKDFVAKKPGLKDVPIEKLNHIFGVNEDYINAAFKKIDEKYKSTEEYLLYEFGLTSKDIEQMRNEYLEKL